MKSHPLSSVILIADEVLEADAAIGDAALHEATLADGRLRVAPIGLSLPPSLYKKSRVVDFQIHQLPRGEVEAVVGGWHARMPREHVDYVSRLAEGNVLLARMIAHVVLDEMKA